MTDAPILRFTAQLKAEGWTDQRIARAVRDGELVRVVRNVYRWPGELTPQQAHLARARGVLSRMGSSVVLSHDSAALAHGLPVATADPAVVHMTTPPPARVRVRSGYHVHVAPLEADDVTEVNGVRVTSLARTACDLARTADFPWAVAAPTGCCASASVVRSCSPVRTQPRERWAPAPSGRWRPSRTVGRGRSPNR